MKTTLKNIALALCLSNALCMPAVMAMDADPSISNPSSKHYGHFIAGIAQETTQILSQELSPGSQKNLHTLFRKMICATVYGADITDANGIYSTNTHNAFKLDNTKKPVSIHDERVQNILKVCENIALFQIKNGATQDNIANQLRTLFTHGFFAFETETNKAFSNLQQIALLRFTMGYYAKLSSQSEKVIQLDDNLKELSISHDNENRKPVYSYEPRSFLDINKNDTVEWNWPKTDFATWTVYNSVGLLNPKIMPFLPPADKANSPISTILADTLGLITQYLPDHRDLSALSQVNKAQMNPAAERAYYTNHWALFSPKNLVNLNPFLTNARKKGYKVRIDLRNIGGTELPTELLTFAEDTDAGKSPIACMKIIYAGNKPVSTNLAALCTSKLAPKIHSLDLFNTHMNNEDLTHVGKLINLEILNLTCCFRVTDITPLASLTKLKVLNICEIMKLKILPTFEALIKLETLDINHTGVEHNEEQIDAFKAVHPECEVITQSTMRVD